MRSGSSIISQALYLGSDREIAFRKVLVSLAGRGVWCVRLAQSVTGVPDDMLRKVAVTGAGVLGAASVGAAYV